MVCSTTTTPNHLYTLLVIHRGDKKLSEYQLQYEHAEQPLYNLAKAMEELELSVQVLGCRQDEEDCRHYS